MKRLATSLFLAGSLFAAAAPALADEGATQLTASSCKGETDKKCISDTIKRWKREKDEFERSIDQKRKAWLEANPQNASAEWETAQKANSNDLRQQVQAYRKQQNDLEKAFYAELKKKQPKADSRVNATGAPSLLPGQDKCSAGDLPEIFRICMRQARIKFLLDLKNKSSAGSSSSASSAN